jgi:hypothetical protein
MLTLIKPRLKKGKTDSRLRALDEFNDGLKANSLSTSRGKRLINAEKKQREDRSAIVTSNRKMPVHQITYEEAKKKQKEKPPKKIMTEAKKEKSVKITAEDIVEKLVAVEKKDGGLDLSDLTFEQFEALKEYGGLTSNMTRKQIDEVINRVSPLTEDGTPFVISTPFPKQRFLPPRRLKVKDIVTGKEIIL